VQPLGDGEVARIVDDGLGAKGAPLLDVLLDERALVVDAEKGRDACGDDARAKAPGVRRVTLRSKMRATLVGNWRGQPRVAAYFQSLGIHASSNYVRFLLWVVMTRVAPLPAKPETCLGRAIAGHVNEVRAVRIHDVDLGVLLPAVGREGYLRPVWRPGGGPEVVSRYLG
jgi:hypothetical protein